MSEEKETVEQKVARLEKELAAEQESKKQIEAQAAEEIARLSQELDSTKEDAARSAVTVTVEKKKYYLIGKRFNIPGKGAIEAKELVKDKETLAALVKAGSGILVEAK